MSQRNGEEFEITTIRKIYRSPKALSNKPFCTAYKVSIGARTPLSPPITTSSRACKAAMAAAALVGDVLLTGGMRPLARGLSVRHTTPASGASAARALSTLATRRLPAAGHSNRGSPRLHSASSASSFASVRCARLEHGKGFRAAVVRCASGDGTHPTALPTTAAEGEEGGVAPSHAAGSAAPPPPADSAPAPAKRASEVEAVPATSFADLGMPKKLCAALERTGFTEPTAPQVSPGKGPTPLPLLKRAAASKPPTQKTTKERAN
jgi:hypothetical protein